MSEDVAIQIKNVSKYFKPSSGQRSIKSLFTNFFNTKEEKSSGNWAVKDISFEIKKGEFFGIVGRNGSGKSTLLKMIAGVYTPTKGEIKTNGKLVPFIELGVGFNPELSGRDNVFLNGALLGFSHKEMEDMYDEIVDFAELKEHMDVKLKNFSSGMQVRLAFSIAIRAKSDVLLIDEVLAVGDADFQRKCFVYFKQLKKENKTVVFVSHDMTTVREYCDRAVLIDKSSLIEIGSASSVSVLYSKTLQGSGGATSSYDSENRFGDKTLRINSLDVKYNSESVLMSFNLTAHDDVEDPVIGFYFENDAGQQISGTNTKLQNIRIKGYKKNEKRNVSIQFGNVFSDGKYSLTLAVLKSGGGVVCDWWTSARTIQIKTDQHVPYLVNIPITYKEKSVA